MFPTSLVFKGITSFATFGCVLFLASTALAVQAPYSDDFDSYADGSAPNNFLTTTTGIGPYGSSWLVANGTGAAGTYSNSAGGDVVRSSAAVSVTNLAQTNFALSTTFIVDSYGLFYPYTSEADIHVGLSALGSSADFSNSGYGLSYELLTSGPYSGDGALQITQGNSGSFPYPTLPMVTGQTYTMTLTGNYSQNGLLLVGTLTDGTDSVSVTRFDSIPEQGTYFGYYDYASGQINKGAYVGVRYDNFAITAVPEPRSLVSFILGLAIMCFAKRLERVQRRPISS